MEESRRSCFDLFPHRLKGTWVVLKINTLIFRDLFIDSAIQLSRHFMKLNYTSEEYGFLVTLMSTNFERKLENETAFFLPPDAFV